VRALFFVVIVVFAGEAQADEHWLTGLDLRYPRWAQALDRSESRPRVGFSLVFPATALLERGGLRLPLDGATFLTLDASIITSQVNPYINTYLPTTRPAYQATLGVAVEY
jgi:hypothetical protein